MRGFFFNISLYFKNPSKRKLEEKLCWENQFFWKKNPFNIGHLQFFGPGFENILDFEKKLCFIPGLFCLKKTLTKNVKFWEKWSKINGLSLEIIW